MASKRRFARRAKNAIGQWIGGGAALAAAGATFAWFRDAGRRARAAESAQRLYSQAGELASTGVRDLSQRARELGDRAQQLTQHARTAADETRARLEGDRVLPGGAGTYRVVAGAAGAFLVARAVLGGGPGRIPAGIIGGGLLGRVLRDVGEARGEGGGTHGGGGGGAKGGTETDAGDAGANGSGGSGSGASAQGAATERGGSTRSSRASSGRRAGATSGKARRQPEVREVKSPAELEPGVASASPDPLRPGRVDRADLRDRDDQRKYDAGAGAGGGETRDAERTDYEVAPHGFSAPATGAAVREADLGIVTPAEDLGEEAEDELAGPGDVTRRDEASGDGAASRREPTSDGG